MHDLGARCRAAAVLVMVAACSALVLALAEPHLPPAPGTFEDTLLAGLTMALVACWTWVGSVAALAAAAVLVRGPRRGLARGPVTGPGRRVRTLVAASCGCGVLALTASPALAETPDRPAAGVLDGLLLPDRVADPPQQRPAGRSSLPAPATVTVRPGDTLWGIAARRAGPDEPNHWRRLYAVNRRTIGADPDLIVPGQRLVVPGPPTHPSPEAAKETHRP